MKSFFDNNLSHRIPRALRECGEDAIHLGERFDETTLDVDFIPKIAAEGYVLFTADDKIRTQRSQRMVLQQCGLTAVFLPVKVGGVSKAQNVGWVLHQWDAIIAAVQRHPQGTLFLMKAGGGKIQTWAGAKLVDA